MAQLKNLPLFNDAALQAYYEFNQNLNNSSPVNNVGNANLAQHGSDFSYVANIIYEYCGYSVNGGVYFTAVGSPGLPFNCQAGLGVGGWFYPTAVPGSGTEYSLFEFANGNQQNRIWVTYLNNAGTYQFSNVWSATGRQDHIFTYNLPNNTPLGLRPHHIFVNFDGGNTNNMTLFIDGLLVMTNNISPVQNGNSGNDNGFYILFDPNGGSFPSYFGDIVYFSRILTNSEVSELAANGAPLFFQQF